MSLRLGQSSPAAREVRDRARQKLEQVYAAMEAQLGEAGAQRVAELREVSRPRAGLALAATATFILAPVAAVVALFAVGPLRSIVVLAAAAACCAAVRTHAARGQRARAARRHELLAELEALAAEKH